MGGAATTTAFFDSAGRDAGFEAERDFFFFFFFFSTFSSFGEVRGAIVFSAPGGPRALSAPGGLSGPSPRGSIFVNVSQKYIKSVGLPGTSKGESLGYRTCYNTITRY